MGQEQQVDWFAQNAPKAAASGDWFADNAPKQQVAAPKPGMWETAKTNLKAMGLLPDHMPTLKDLFVPPGGNQVQNVVGEGDLRSAPRFAAPGAKAPLPNALSEAGAAANFGVGVGDGPMGAPKANLAGLANDALSVTGEAGKAVGRGVSAAAEATKGALGKLREPGVYNSTAENPIAPGAPPPRGPLKPLANLGSKVVGAATGAALGGAELGPWGVVGGAGAGWKAGPEIADAIIPANPNPIDPRPSAGEILNRPGLKPFDQASTAIREGTASELPTELPQRASAGEVVSKLPPWDATTQAIKQGTAVKLPNRVPKAEMPPASFSPIGATSTDASTLRNLSSSPTTVTSQVAEPTGTGGITSTGPAVQIGPKVAEPKTPQIITPDRAPKFTGSEGTAARWTNERVMELAKQGNREAIQQAVRRGFELPPNARYIAGDASYGSGVYNPRDVTKFSPEGTPIRMQGGPRNPRPTGATIEMPPARMNPIEEPGTPTPAAPMGEFETPSAQAVLREHAPELRALASRLESTEPEIAQHLIDISDGKSLGLEQIAGKIRDPQAAAEFAGLLDNARRSARTAQAPALANQPSGAGSQVGGSAQAPELKLRTDSNGIVWAESPNGVRVSVPPSVKPAEVMSYARQKLAEQSAAQANILKNLKSGKP